MCGILGHISNQPIDSTKLNLMLDAINHRGPDGRGTKSFEINRNLNCSLGHVRLSILDLSELGSQPMSYRDRYWITYNGEIYNFKEVREELKEKNYDFVSGTDTEVLLAAFCEWGPNSLKKLNGMFAFSIFDSHTKEIFIARDRFGVKPLYYFKDKDTFAFASEIKALMANDDIRDSVKPNIKECKNYLKKGPQVWREETLFTKIKRFPKACFYLGSLEGLFENELNTQVYYKLPTQAVMEKKDDLLIEEYRDLFSSAVKLRLRADVDIGTALSGGLDSSSIAYFINQELKKNNSPEKQKTFSSVYWNEDYSHYDESTYIDSVAKKLDVDSRKVDIKMEIMLQDYEKIIWAHDNPPEGIPLSGWLTYKLVKESGVTISIDGQGADEQLAGYETYLINHLAHMSSRDFFKEIKKIYNFPYPSRQIFTILFFFFLNRLKLSKPFSYLLKFFFGSSFDPTNTLREILHRTFNENLMTLLFHGDKQSMAWSVETRLPYMDYRVVEFISNLRDDLKIRDGWTKYINRKAVDGLLSDEVVWRKNKLGWPVPEKEWLDGPLKNWADSIVTQSSFVKNITKYNLGVFLNRNRTKFKVRKLNLAIWHKLFFENNAKNFSLPDKS